jgi:Domain of unknown function (DUF4115)
VVLALALLVVGGMALVNALASSGSNRPDGQAAVSPTPNETASPTQRKTRPAQPTVSARTPLVIRVVGAPTQVVVRVSGDGGEVLQQGTLNTGEARQFEQAPLDVVASNGASVEVVIYGRKQPPKPSGTRGEWFVPER